MGVQRSTLECRGPSYRMGNGLQKARRSVRADAVTILGCVVANMSVLRLVGAQAAKASGNNIKEPLPLGPPSSVTVIHRRPQRQMAGIEAHRPPNGEAFPYHDPPQSQNHASAQQNAGVSLNLRNVLRPQGLMYQYTYILL